MSITFLFFLEKQPFFFNVCSCTQILRKKKHWCCHHCPLLTSAARSSRLVLQSSHWGVF